MSRYCDDCGTRYANGVCPNCSEELFIETTQGEFIESRSDDWTEKVDEQVQREKRKLKEVTK